ncbi:hypothetical protein Tco_0399228, partial [Tanacetum coccineum]
MVRYWFRMFKGDRIRRNLLRKMVQQAMRERKIELGMPMQHPRNSNYFKDKMLVLQAQENGAVLDNAAILSEAGDLENAIDPSDNHQVEHEIHDEVQQ